MKRLSRAVRQRSMGGKPLPVVLDGLPPVEAVRWVRREFHPRAVETPWQRWWLRRVR